MMPDPCYQEYEEHALPARLVSLLDATRKRLQAKGRGRSDLRQLGTDPGAVEGVRLGLSSASLQRLLESGENRLRADDDAWSYFRYGPWLADDPASHEELCREIGTFMPGASPSGFFWYPAGGYMGWHTNSNRPGKRLFCTYVEQGHESFFRYRDPRDERVHTSWDRLGWTFRAFDVGEDPGDLLWHCLFSAVDRMSFGFYLPAPQDHGLSS